ncbi:MAG: hypothetical protein VB859_08000 [Planctomycetaceae bacterium]
MRKRQLFCTLLVLLSLTAAPELAFSWSKGHRLIRLWALSRLCRGYTSLQDQHAGGKAPQLDPYCIVPGVRLSLQTESH